jgi:hypothetical protein
VFGFGQQYPVLDSISWLEFHSLGSPLKAAVIFHPEVVFLLADLVAFECADCVAFRWVMPHNLMEYPRDGLIC